MNKYAQHPHTRLNDDTFYSLSCLQQGDEDESLLKPTR